MLLYDSMQLFTRILWPQFRQNAVLVFMLGICACNCWAEQGKLDGTITDQRKRPVIGATIAVLDLSGNTVSRTESDAQGAFRFMAIESGDYHVVVSAKTFQPYDTRITVSSGTTSIEAALAISTVLQTIEVKSSASISVAPDDVSSLGLLNGNSLLKTPYSVFVVGQELLASLQATTIDQVLRVVPSSQINQPQSYGSQAYGMVRGFKVDNFQSFEDGIQSSNSLMNLEDKERIELLSGVSGAFYGMTSPGGVINYVTKKPTWTPFATFTLGDVSNSSAYTHLDLGGLLVKNRLAYRLNIAGQYGDTAIHNQDEKRDMASAVLEWALKSEAKIEVNYSHDDYHINGTTAKWTFSSGLQYPSAPRVDELWGQKYGFSNENRDKVGAAYTQKFGSHFVFHTRYSHEYLIREGVQFNNVVTNNSGLYAEKMTIWAPWTYSIDAGLVSLESRFATGPLHHTLTIGWLGRNINLKEHIDNVASVTLSGSFSISDPVYVSKPTYSVGAKTLVPSTRTENRNAIFSDTIDLTHGLFAIVGAAQSDIITNAHTLSTGAISSRYEKSSPSPSASLIYMPQPRLSTYFTFAQGIEKGGKASATDTNANQIMPPMVSKQYEAGIKARIGNALVSLAVFDLNKAYEYDLVNTDATTRYYQSGRQIHKGIETTMSGRPVSSLYVYGGFVLLNPAVRKNTANPTINGKSPVDVAKQQFKVHAEYNVPRVNNLALIGGINYAGRIPANTVNTAFVPNTTLGDIGARWRGTYHKVPTTLSFNADNITGRNYWLNSTYLGSPRNFNFGLHFDY
jgi:iron complex outermembrane receptor protein